MFQQRKWNRKNISFISEYQIKNEKFRKTREKVGLISLLFFVTILTHRSPKQFIFNGINFSAACDPNFLYEIPSSYWVYGLALINSIFFCGNFHSVFLCFAFNCCEITITPVPTPYILLFLSCVYLWIFHFSHKQHISWLQRRGKKIHCSTLLVIAKTATPVI